MPIKKLLERSALPIAIILTIFITTISLVHLNGVPSIKISNSDKLGHFVAYLLLSLSWFYALKNFPKIYILVFFLISYGIIIEVLQGVLTTYRQADFYDVIANVAGVLFAIILYRKIK
ncbi:MAG: VanZ family protein [Flavobacteriaceae bacterium]|nr:VanZ family protein [Flavobacteriaceae bacterium]